MTVVKPYKFQGLVTLHAADAGGPCPELGSTPRRMVLRGWDDETGRSQLFPVLVSCEDDRPFLPGGPRILVTLRMADDHAADYLGVGRQFCLWLGGDIGEGMIIRRLFV